MEGVLKTFEQTRHEMVVLDRQIRLVSQNTVPNYKLRYVYHVCHTLQKKKGRKTGLHIECVTPYKGRYRMLIKYCVISNILKYIPDSGIYRFPLVVSVCTQWQVKHIAAAEIAEFRKITTF